MFKQRFGGASHRVSLHKLASSLDHWQLSFQEKEKNAWGQSKVVVGWGPRAAINTPAVFVCTSWSWAGSHRASRPSPERKRKKPWLQVDTSEEKERCRFPASVFHCSFHKNMVLKAREISSIPEEDSSKMYCSTSTDWDLPYRRRTR